MSTFIIIYVFFKKNYAVKKLKTFAYEDVLKWLVTIHVMSNTVLIKCQKFKNEKNC